MEKDIDFTKLSNYEINLKLMAFDNEYNSKKSKIIEMIQELEVLDKLYIRGKEELKKRGALSDE